MLSDLYGVDCEAEELSVSDPCDDGETDSHDCDYDGSIVRKSPATVKLSHWNFLLWLC